MMSATARECEWQLIKNWAYKIASKMIVVSYSHKQLTCIFAGIVLVSSARELC